MVGQLTRIPEKNVVSGLAITRDCECFVSTYGPGESSLYRCGLNTAELPLIGLQENAPQITGIAATCDGTLFGHDNVTDDLYTGNGSVDLIGPHGLNASSTQDLAYDRQAGIFYAYIYTGNNGAGSYTFEQVNTSDGSINPLSVGNPNGGFVGASQTVCSGPITTHQAVDASSTFFLLICMMALMFVCWLD